MLINFARTVILYIVIIASMRILGKRQIGELQPAELVITILLSEILAIPMQDTSLPLMNTVIPVLLLVGFEIIVSILNLKSVKFRSTMQGNPITVIRKGELDQKQLKELRFTTDDLLEELRKKDIFDISEVWYAIVETDGTLSVMLKAENENVKIKDTGIKKSEAVYKSVVISDGSLIEKNLSQCNTTKAKVERLLRKKNLEIGNVLLMTMDENEKYEIIERDKSL